MPPDTSRLALPLRASLFHITHDFYHYGLMTLLNFLHTPLSGATQKCFQSGTAPAKAYPGGQPLFWFKLSAVTVALQQNSQTNIFNFILHSWKTNFI